MSLISIIIPNYNNAYWLAKTIESCLNQGREFIREIIIVDDFSTDNSWDVLNEYQSKYPDLIKPFMNKFAGSNNARNLGFEVSTGTYIQWLDADDQLLSGKFKTQLAKFDEVPDADIVYSDWQMDYYENKLFQRSEFFPAKQHDDFLYQLLLNKWLPCNSYLHKRSIVERTIKMNGWNPDTFTAQDREYITVSAILGAKFVYAKGNFCIYNRWSKNTISQVDHKRAIISALELEKRFYSLIVVQGNINDEKKREYNKIFNTTYLTSLFYYPAVKHYKLISPFNISPSLVHNKLRSFLALLMVYSWIKYFFGAIINPVRLSIKIYRRLKHMSRYYFSSGHINILFRDKKLNKEVVSESYNVHLLGAMNWLKVAQDRSSSRGVSMYYSFYSGWHLAYPETTGYIIDTFVDYYKFTGDTTYFERAIEMGLWETEVQMKDGSVRVGTPYSKLVDVFDTGMVLLGYTTLYSETKDDIFLQAAVKAGNWLCNSMDENGAWSKFSFKHIPHAYHSKVSWALYKLFLITGKPAYYDAVNRNIKWIFSHKKQNGWIDFMAFSSTEDPYTHTIAYTMQGFLELHKLIPAEDPLNKMLFDEVISFCNKLMDVFSIDRQDGSDNMFLLPGTINENWLSEVSYVCLTGNAQFSIVYYDLYTITKNERYYKTATNLLNIVSQTQKLTGVEPIKGAIAGSYPFWGDYHPHEYPNWATKFFADALMRKIEIDLKR